MAWYYMTSVGAMILAGMFLIRTYSFLNVPQSLSYYYTTRTNVIYDFEQFGQGPDNGIWAATFWRMIGNHLKMGFIAITGVMLYGELMRWIAQDVLVVPRIYLSGLFNGIRLVLFTCSALFVLIMLIGNIIRMRRNVFLTYKARGDYRGLDGQIKKHVRYIILLYMGIFEIVYVLSCISQISIEKV